MTCSHRRAVQRLLTASNAPFWRILSLRQAFLQYKERPNVILSHILLNFLFFVECRLEVAIPPQFQRISYTTFLTSCLIHFISLWHKIGLLPAFRNHSPLWLFFWAYSMNSFLNAFPLCNSTPKTDKTYPFPENYTSIFWKAHKNSYNESWQILVKFPLPAVAAHGILTFIFLKCFCHHGALAQTFEENHKQTKWNHLRIEANPHKLSQ